MHKTTENNSRTPHFPEVKNRESTEDVLLYSSMLYRVVYDSQDISSLLNCHSVKKLIARGDLHPFKVLPENEKASRLKLFADYLRPHDKNRIHILEQKTINVENSPSHWTSSMWVEAAKLVLKISDELLENSLELTQVSPQDIQFIFTKPVFINPSRIQKISSDSYEWKASRDFRYRFINPTLRYVEIGIPFQQSLLYENGVEPESLFKEAGFFRSLTPSLFTSALVPTILNQQAKKKNFFFFPAEPKLEEVLAYRKNLFARFRKEIDKIEETNLIKTRRKATEVPTTTEAATENWIREQINFLHPRTLLEINSKSILYTKYASEIGIACTTLQVDEQMCDKLYRESRKLDLNNLCLNLKLGNLKVLRFDMVIVNIEHDFENNLEYYCGKEFFLRLSDLSTRFVLVKTPNQNDFIPYFTVVDSTDGYVLLEKKKHSLNVV